MLDNTFIQNLQKKIEETEIYAPTGKYGKMELSSYKTKMAKFNLLLSANPTSIDDIVAYIQFLESLDALKNQKISKKVATILKYSEAKDDADTLSIARELVQQNEVQLMKLKRRPYIRTAIVESIILLPIILWYFLGVIGWDDVWKFAWYTGAIILFIILNAVAFFSS